MSDEDSYCVERIEFLTRAAFGFVLAEMALRPVFTGPHFVPDRSGTARVNSRIPRR